MLDSSCYILLHAQLLGKWAVSRGPLIYCAEGADNGKPLEGMKLKKSWDPKQQSLSYITQGILKNVYMIRIPAYSQDSDELGSVLMLPYYAWNNRGDGAMKVWFPTQSSLQQEIN